MSQELISAITEMREDDALKLTTELLDGGTNPVEVLDACRQAMDVIGKRFETGESFIPELILAGEMLNAITEILKPRMAEEESGEKLGKFVLGTVQGDIHDIAKDIVGFMLELNGFEVIDLGVDVPPAKFVDAVKESGAKIVGLSGFLTLAFDPMKDTVAALKDAGFDDVKVMIGGGQIDEQIREYTGADAYGRDAMDAVTLAKTGHRSNINVEKPNNWNELTPMERRKLRLDHWQNQPVEFASPEAEANYKERIERLRKTYDMDHPDRIIADISMGASEFALRRKGLTGKDMLYSHEKMREPLMEFHEEFQPDTAVGMLPYPGKVFDMLDFKTYAWGGNQLPDSMVIQAVEGEYMMGDEYVDFIADPTAFWLKTYLPRVLGELGPLAMLPDFPRISENVDIISLVAPFGLPPFQEMLKKLMAAGDELMKMLPIVGQTSAMIAGAGFPSMAMNIVKTPFDYLGDTLRGTKGILMDMFRRPDELLAACEAYVPILIKTLVQANDQAGAPSVTYVLHKGADTFMSDEQFKKFYWPTWKEVMMGLYEEGITSYLFVEGSYNNRLEYLAEMPEKSLLCHFDQTDMKRVKEVLSDKFIIAGNVPASLMSTGTVDGVRAYCDELVELYEDAPGYIMSFGCSFEMTTDEKLRAYMDSVKK